MSVFAFMSTYEAVLHSDAAQVNEEAGHDLTSVLTKITGNPAGLHGKEMLPLFLWLWLPTLVIQC